MFQEIESEYSFVSWVAQLVLACLAPEIALFIVIGLVSKVIDPFLTGSNYVGHTSAVISYGLVFVMFTIFAALSAGLAMFVSKTWRNACREGRFTWVIPASLAIVVLLVALLSGDRDLYSIFNGTASGEVSGWVFALLICPAFSSSAYSATMWWLYRERRKARAGQWSQTG